MAKQADGSRSDLSNLSQVSSLSRSPSTSESGSSRGRADSGTRDAEDDDRDDDDRVDAAVAAAGDAAAEQPAGLVLNMRINLAGRTSITEFCLVSLGFIGFHRVLPILRGIRLV